MFQQIMATHDLLALVKQVWDTHQIEIGDKEINGKTKAPDWLVEKLVSEARLNESLITFTPHQPYPDRQVYQFVDSGVWKILEAYHWHEIHPVNGILFSLLAMPGIRQYQALKRNSTEWHTLRAYLSAKQSLNILDGFYVRDYDTEKRTFRYYPAKEIAEKAESLGSGHRWHRRRFKSIRVFLDLENVPFDKGETA